MNYSIDATDLFEKQLKRLIKKHASIKKDFFHFILKLKEDPKIGNSIGSNCYKIRMAISSKGKGKSGGARIITHIHIARGKIYLLSIYDKSEQSDITDKDLKNWLEKLK